MIDQNSQFFAILTNVGAAKQSNADALGIAWKITQMGVGDANNADPLPSATQTALLNEWRRAPLNQLKVDPNNAAIIIAEQVIPADVGGRWIREIGLYDADGDLVAVANCAPSFKPLLNQGSGRTQVVRMNLQVSNASSVELKIDPSVVLATRSYVDQKVVDELARLDFKQSVRAAATAAIVLSGLQTVDGVALVVGDRVLVPLQATAKDNGIYVVAAGAWARSADADLGAEVTASMFVPVEEGGVNGDSLWQLVANGPIVLGTTALVFEMLAGRTGVNAGTYRSLTVDKYGRVTGGTSPTTLAGYGIDSATKVEAEAGDNAKPLTAQGALWVLGKVKGFAKFTANGSFTVPAGVTQIWLSGCAGGGGGGSGSGGTNSARGSGGGSGGAGQNIQKELYAVNPGQVIPITIGAGGSGGVGVGTQNAVGNVGTNGGNTVIGTLVTLTAGGGGSYGTDGTGGTRGAGWPNGSHGSDGVLAGVGGGSGDGHVGASGPFGGGGGGSRAVGSSASNASGYGAGGGGGAGGGAPGTPSSNGGNGSPGLVIIEY